MGKVLKLSEEELETANKVRAGDKRVHTNNNIASAQYVPGTV